MILLENYSKKNTDIKINSQGYSIVDANSISEREDGEGGFSEDGELLGVYVMDDKLYFQYKDKSYQAKTDEICCTNQMLDDGRRHFKVKIREGVICDIIYKPYISPLALTFGDDEDEFDFLLYLSKLIQDENSILKFIRGINNLKQYYSNNS